MQRDAHHQARTIRLVRDTGVRAAACVVSQDVCLSFHRRHGIPRTKFRRRLFAAGRDEVAVDPQMNRRLDYVSDVADKLTRVSLPRCTPKKLSRGRLIRVTRRSGMDQRIQARAASWGESRIVMTTARLALYEFGTESGVEPKWQRRSVIPNTAIGAGSRGGIWATEIPLRFEMCYRMIARCVSLVKEAMVSDYNQPMIPRISMPSLMLAGVSLCARARRGPAMRLPEVCLDGAITFLRTPDAKTVAVTGMGQCLAMRKNGASFSDPGARLFS
jgi:hypothetical protein